MARWFNVSGPCDPAKHYMLPTAARLPSVHALIDQEAYFVVHAPRQVGKTTSLLALAQELTAARRYAAALVTLKPGAPFADDPDLAERAILDGWRDSLRWLLPAELLPPEFPDAAPGARLGRALTTWAEACPRPLVLFLDEVDSLRDAALLSVLRQLRAGFARRPHAFPHALCLVGLRDVRDYVVKSGGQGRMGSSSPFNIKAESLTLRNFTEGEVAALYQQHTDDTGQAFAPEASARAFDLTQGLPWLVNALARQRVEVLVPDRAQAVTADDVTRAKDLLIERQDTHLDSLSERLREPRVRQIVEPMLAGELLTDMPRDDVRYACDLGLLRYASTGSIEVANPIYREIIVRDLASTTRATLPTVAPSWLRSDGTLDTDALLESFLAFWRQHGEPLLKSAPYHEVAPHLVMMAYLHRVVNGGGRVEREYALGMGRMDLLVCHGDVRLPIELKGWREGRKDPKAEGLEQLDGYLGRLGLDATRDPGWLVIFDRRAGQPPIEERTSAERVTTPAGRSAVVLRA